MNYKESERYRFRKIICMLTASVIAVSGLPSMVLADMLNAPSYYSVQSNLDYEITTNITSSWINHESVDFVITNTGDETIHNWYLTFTTPYGIDNIWNGEIFETDGNGTYTITSNGWNQDIHPGESVTVGATFSSATETDVSIAPQWYLLNTQATVVDASQYTLEYTEYSAWESGFTGQLTLTPMEDCQHWELSFDSNREITAVSSAVLSSEGDYSYEITHDENNMRLFANNAYNFGIQGVSSEESLTLSNVELTAVDLAYHLTDDEDGNGVPDYLDFIGGGSVVEPTPTPTPTEIPTTTPTEEPTGTPTTEPSETETPTPTEEPTPTPIIDYDLDRDLDGLPDYIEEQIGTDPLKADTDEDGLEDYPEILMGYDPLLPDSDGNGVSDGNEDCDADGLSNLYELQTGTSPMSEDSDCDGLNDGDEVNIYGTDPLSVDSDEDGIYDGDEVAIGKNPSDSSDGNIRISQSYTKVINNTEDPVITSVSVTSDLAGKIDRVLRIRDYYNIDIYSTDVYGRIGSPINFECSEGFDAATVVIHYDETNLGNTGEENLGVLWYDEENGIYDIQEQAVTDTQNNTITLTLNHFSTYVVVDLELWNNPIVPDYSDYIYEVEEAFRDNIFYPTPRTAEEMEIHPWTWWHLTHSNMIKLATLRSEAIHSGNLKWDYEYTWLVMDNTDNDEDGVLDFMEDSGILGSNHHIYFADSTNPDGDGDTISDDEEIGARYVIHKTLDGVLRIVINGAVVYESSDGLIDSNSEYYILQGYCDSISNGQIRIIAIIESDARKLDSDDDESYDAIDAYPIRVNPLINYLIVGHDNLGSNVLNESADHYERLFQNEDMDYIRYDISSADEFIFILAFLKKIDKNFPYNDSALEYYRAVDNLIVVCHGDPTGLVFNNADIATSGLSNRYWSDDLYSIFTTPVNVVDYNTCYSAYQYSDRDNTAYDTLYYCENVSETYGWEGETRYEVGPDMNSYEYGDNVGYVRYYRNDNGGINWEIEPETSYRWVIFPILRASYVYSGLHSTVSSGGY